MTGVEEIRAQALAVAAGWSPPDAPESWRLTAALFRVIASHHELLARLAPLPADRLPALLASAAISYVVRRDRPKPLADYFPEAGMRQPPLDSSFDDEAAAFVTDHLDEIVATCDGRRYQMNEVARCAQIALGVAAATDPSPGPIALVDLRAGAGFGLHLDRYRYQIGGQVSGPADAWLEVRCEARGPRQLPPLRLPPIAERAGIELDQIDLNDPAALAWLQACTPPEAAALTRLAQAVSVVRRNPVTVVPGNVADELPGVLAGLPPDLPVIVVDAYLAVFQSPSERAQLAGTLARAGRTRPVTWLSLDPLVPLGPHGDASVQGLPVPASLVRDYQRNGVFAVLGARTFEGDSDHGRLLARAHPSGQWVEWIA